MNESERAQAISGVRRLADRDDISAGEKYLGRALLAEHAEVLTCRDKIADLSDQVTASAARAIAREQEHVSDLRAARGALTRLRESILAGCLDVTQARAAEAALLILDGEQIMPSDERALAAALLASIEAHREARAEIARLKAMGRVIGMGPAI